MYIHSGYRMIFGDCKCSQNSYKIKSYILKFRDVTPQVVFSAPSPSLIHAPFYLLQPSFDTSWVSPFAHFARNSIPPVFVEDLSQSRESCIPLDNCSNIEVRSTHRRNRHMPPRTRVPVKPLG